MWLLLAPVLGVLVALCLAASVIGLLVVLLIGPVVFCIGVALKLPLLPLRVMLR